MHTFPGPLEKASTLDGLTYTTMDSGGPPTASPGGSTRRLRPSLTCCLYSSTLSPDTCADLSHVSWLQRALLQMQMRRDCALFHGSLRRALSRADFASRYSGVPGLAAHRDSETMSQAGVRRPFCVSAVHHRCLCTCTVKAQALAQDPHSRFLATHFLR